MKEEIKVAKRHYGQKVIDGELHYYQVKSLIERDVEGCWFDVNPIKKWVSVKWLENNGYKAIAERIKFLISVNGDNKRYIVTLNKVNNNLLLNTVEKAILMEMYQN